MASQATRQRKGGMGTAPKSGEQLTAIATMGSAIAHATTKKQQSSIPISLKQKQKQNQQPTTIVTSSITSRTLRPAVIKEAKVKRNKYGTGPFDEHWLNMDCCGLFCASLTYMLHAYGVYAVCWILIPPWMSSVDQDGIRTMSGLGHFHRCCFTTIAGLAVYSHFKAMTTNPGAVPPDAIPMEEMKEMFQNKNNNNNNNENGEQTSSSLMIEDKPPPRKGKRLCRRCSTFKPKRAHHCSVCKRCIIKMDRKFTVLYNSTMQCMLLLLLA